jgi:D-sedoheptulose 7-phosphate isomerase
VGRFLRERRGLPALTLAGNPAILTAIGNDYGFEAVFERQIQAVGPQGDVAWGISTSGNSENVVRGLKSAKALGLKTVGLTGVRARKVRAVVRRPDGGSAGRNPSNPGSAPGDLSHHLRRH